MRTTSGMRYLLLFLALPLLAEITPEQQRDYFQAVSTASNLKLEVIKAEAAVQAEIAKMAEACKATKLIVNEKGQPVCASPAAEPALSPNSSAPVSATPKKEK